MHSITEIQALPQALSPSRRYDRLAVCFHWAVFLLVALAYAAIELKGNFAKGTPPRALAMTVHEWAGALVLVLAVPRLLWRLVRGAPARSGRALDAAGQRGHALGALPVYPGPAAAGAAGDERRRHLLALPSLGMEVPALVAADPALKDTVKAIHETLGTAFYLVIGLHAMASLFHHYMLGDNTLRRMWR